jgi:uncharacterized membrane protein YphA (DoxX/SURF4 family)
VTAAAEPARPRDWVSLLARLLLGGVFVALAVLKIVEPVGFLKAVRQFGVVAQTDPTLLNAVAAWLPWLELWCGLLLLLGVGVRGAALLVLAMLLVFTPAIASRGLELQRAEGGTGVVNVCSKLAQNTGLIVLALIALLVPPRRLALRPELLGSQRPT